MTPSYPRAVIFDWDNTLVDSWTAIADAINYVRARYGQPTWTREHIMKNCTRSARESFPDWFGDKWQAAWDDYYAFFDKVRKEQGIHALPGANDLLTALRAKAIPALVVSNKSDHYLQQEAVELGWQGFFAVLAGAHSASKDKPAREHADFALAKAGLAAGADVWFVGDSSSDVKCALAAGCTPIFIGDEAEGRALGAEICVSGCPELLDLLSKAQRAMP